MMHRAALLALLLLWLARAVSAEAAENRILVLAAASLQEPLNRIADGFTASAGVAVILSYGSSGALARQAAAGAPAQLYVSASEQWADWLSAQPDAHICARAVLASNRLVLIQPRTAPRTLSLGADLLPGLGDGRLAIGDPRHVPAGIYAQAALQELGLWESLRSRLVEMPDVRGVLAMVERGETPAGFVYRSDARASSKVQIAAEVPASLHPPIRYVVMLLASGEENTAAARAFYDWLLSPAAGEILRDAGFTDGDRP